MLDLLQPKEIEFALPNGGTKAYIISKFPAVQGREIVAKYPVSNMPKLGDYNVSEEIMLKLMSFVAIEINGRPQRLSTMALINNHVDGWETLAKIEMAMMEYNCSFFTNGKALNSLTELCQNIIQKILRTSTSSSGPSSPTNKPPSMS